VSDRLDLETARNALEIVLEALDVPYAATVGGDEIRAEIMSRRTMHAVILLRGLLGRDTGRQPLLYPQNSIDWCREQLAKHPAEGYRTWDQAVVERHAAEAGEPR
jgi:hypothetical protein